MTAILSIHELCKTYPGNREALKNVSLEIRRGEIFALLGPNGAGKTTLIGIVCGLVNPTSGRVVADGHDVVRDFRAARRAPGVQAKQYPSATGKRLGPAYAAWPSGPRAAFEQTGRKGHVTWLMPRFC